MLGSQLHFQSIVCLKFLAEESVVDVPKKDFNQILLILKGIFSVHHANFQPYRLVCSLTNQTLLEHFKILQMPTLSHGQNSHTV